MPSNAILAPMILQMGLMVCVTFWLVWARVGSVMRGKVTFKSVRENGWQGWIKNAGDNFDNQFQIPLLFLIVCLTFLVTGGVTQFVVILAWIFFVFRVLHAIIHLSYNNVNHRFLVFFISTLAVFVMIGVLAKGLV